MASTKFARSRERAGVRTNVVPWFLLENLMKAANAAWSSVGIRERGSFFYSVFSRGKAETVNLF